MIVGEASSANSESRIWLSLSKSTFESIEASDILYVVAQNHHIHINLKGDRKYVVKSSLGSFYEKSLNEFNYFKRIGRSYVVNINRIDRVENNRLIMEDNYCIPIPRDRKDEVLKELGIRFD